MIMHLRPDLVRQDQLKNFTPLSVAMERDFEILVPEGKVGFGWQTQDLHPEGACGDATDADCRARPPDGRARRGTLRDLAARDRPLRPRDVEDPVLNAATAGKAARRRCAHGCGRRPPNRHPPPPGSPRGAPVGWRRAGQPWYESCCLAVVAGWLARAGSSWPADGGAGCRSRTSEGAAMKRRIGRRTALSWLAGTTVAASIPGLRRARAQTLGSGQLPLQLARPGRARRLLPGGRERHLPPPRHRLRPAPGRAAGQQFPDPAQRPGRFHDGRRLPGAELRAREPAGLVHRPRSSRRTRRC
jgi:hypothetical protein